MTASARRRLSMPSQEATGARSPHSHWLARAHASPFDAMRRRRFNNPPARRLANETRRHHSFEAHSEALLARLILARARPACPAKVINRRGLTRTIRVR